MSKQTNAIVCRSPSIWKTPLLCGTLGKTEGKFSKSAKQNSLPLSPRPNHGNDAESQSTRHIQRYLFSPSSSTPSRKYQIIPVAGGITATQRYQVIYYGSPRKLTQHPSRFFVFVRFFFFNCKKG